MASIRSSAEVGEHLAQQPLTGTEPAVHRRPCEPELAGDRLHVDAFGCQQAPGRERQRLVARGGRRPPRACCGGVGHLNSL